MMPRDEQEAKETLHVLSQSFDVEPDAFLAETSHLTLDDVRRFLIHHVSHLLDHNPSLLMYILYRIDVAERDVKQVFEESAHDQIPGDLADLLIVRQLQKIRTRARYQDGA